MAAGRSGNTYGPLWTQLETTIVHVLNGVRTQLFAFKLVAVASSLGSAVFIWMILGRVRPELRLLGTVAYLCNPMILVELAGDGHNELGPWRRIRCRHRRAVVGCPLRSAVGRSRNVEGPVLSGRPGNTGSTQTVLIEVLSRLLPVRAAEPLVYGLLVAGFAAYLWRSSSVSDAESLLRSCASVAAAYMLFVSPVYWLWYAVLPVALMALVPTGVFLPLLVAISLGSRLVAPLDVLFDHDVIGRPAFLLVTWVGAIGLPIIVLLVWFVRSRSHRASAPCSSP